MMKKAPVLEVTDLEKTYGGRKVVNGLSFHVNPGEIVGLLGPNGAGKTTAFYMTVGLVKPERGRVSFQGEEVTKLPMDRRAKMGMGYLAQEPSVFRQLTVEKNIMCILENIPLTKAQRKTRLQELLSELNLAPLAKKKAASLSGGERRRLEITRALATDPNCLMLDEPFANIDPLSVHELKEIIRHLADRGISLLITDHNAREIFSIVNRSYLVHDGRVLCSGTVDTLIKDQRVRQTYLGHNFTL